MSSFQDQLDEIADAFCVGPQPLERWRPFVRIDADQLAFDPPHWTPEGYNTELIRQRNDQARCAYQYTQLLQLSEDMDASVIESLELMRACAILDMRFKEISIANFQLLTQTIGVENRNIAKDDLYLAALVVHCTHLYLHDMIAQGFKMKKNNRKDILALRPYSGDSRVSLARSLCNSVRAVHLNYLKAFGILRDGYNEGRDDAGKELGLMIKRMQLLMQQLDKVLVVLVDAEGQPAVQAKEMSL